METIYDQAKRFRNDNKFDSAEILLHKIISNSSESTPSQILKAKALNSLGLLYASKGEQKKALDSYYKSIKINEEAGNFSGLVGNYNNLANYYSLDNKKIALKYYQKALDALPDKNKGKKSGILNMNMGNLFSAKDFKRSNYDSAVFYYLNALKSFKTVNDSSNMSLLYHNLGFLYEKDGNLKAALNNYLNSLEYKKALKDLHGLANTYLGIGNVFLKQEKFQESLVNYEKSLDYSEDVGDYNLKMHLYSNMVKAKMGIGAVNEASLLFQKYNDLRDSLFDNEKMEEVKNLETKYETERKEEEIRAQQIAIERKNFQKNLFLSLSILLIVLMISTTWFFIQKQKYLKRLKNEEIANMKTEQELKELNAMMHGQEEERNRIASDLHDRLGARLSSIKLLFQSSEIPAAAEKVLENINEAIKETREISHNLSTDLLSRFGLETALKDTVRTINDAEKIKADLAIYGLDKRLSVDIERNIYHIVLELINNTIKHAKANNINLQISQSENEINVFYEDDGIGFDVQNVVDSGMGMRSIYARVNTIDGAVYFNSKPGGGINVVMSIPVKIAYEEEKSENTQSKLA
ncbi:MAG: tetratricopeptide repeat-containing sensor histidine kinase [Bacteroidota bacterium]